MHHLVVNLIGDDVRNLIFALRVFFEMLGSFCGIAAGPAEEAPALDALYVRATACFMGYWDATLWVRAFTCAELQVKLCKLFFILSIVFADFLHDVAVSKVDTIDGTSLEGVCSCLAVKTKQVLTVLATPCVGFLVDICKTIAS